MDADDLLYWIAFYSLENEEYKKTIQQKIDADVDLETKKKLIEQLFRAKPDGKNKK